MNNSEKLEAFKKRKRFRVRIIENTWTRTLFYGDDNDLEFPVYEQTSNGWKFHCNAIDKDDNTGLIFIAHVVGKSVGIPVKWDDIEFEQ